MTKTSILTPLCVLAALAACGEQSPPPSNVTVLPATDDDRPSNQPPAPPPSPEPRPGRRAVQETAGSDSAAAPGRFQWTGRYAASAEMCRNNQDWRFTNVSVETAGETSCRIKNVREIGDEVRLALSCTAEGMATEERWTLQPADGDRIRLRREGSGAPQELSLLFCDRG